MRLLKSFAWAMLLLGLVACSATRSDTTPPATLVDLETLPTAIFLTQNAPPPGFGIISLEPVDGSLSVRQGWAYTMTGQFSGTFDQTGQPAVGRFEIVVQANELGQARRVVLEVEGQALSPDDGVRRLEAVRLSNDYYLVNAGGECTIGSEGAAAVADLAAGQVIGGIGSAVPTGHRQEINGVPAWQYTFGAESLRLPAVHTAPGSALDVAADLWFAPDYNAVLRFDLSLTVQSVWLLWADRAASGTVSGTLTLRYELDITQFDTLPNISVPHGC